MSAVLYGVQSAATSQPAVFFSQTNWVTSITLKSIVQSTKGIKFKEGLPFYLITK
jgi:hypothetical protein